MLAVAILEQALSPLLPVLAGAGVVLLAAWVWYRFIYRQRAHSAPAFANLGPFYIAARPYTVAAGPDASLVQVDWQLRNEITRPQALDPAGIALVVAGTSYLPPASGSPPVTLQPRETRSLPATYTLPPAAAAALAAGRAATGVALRQAVDGPLSLAMPIALTPRGD